MADVAINHALTLVGVDALRRVGITVDVQTMDFATSVRRRTNHGGWNVFFAVILNAYTFTPAGNYALRSNGLESWDGWPTSPRIEELYQDWLDAGDLDAERRICRELQMQLWQDVPYIPMGEFIQWTCYRRSITGVPSGFSLFYGARPV